ncbi:MAG: hypothetical protein EOP06_23235, partial [Proteobacteria bacterium]
MKLTGGSEGFILGTIAAIHPNMVGTRLISKLVVILFSLLTAVEPLFAAGSCVDLFTTDSVMPHEDFPAQRKLRTQSARKFINEIHQRLFVMKQHTAVDAIARGVIPGSGRYYGLPRLADLEKLIRFIFESYYGTDRIAGLETTQAKNAEGKKLVEEINSAKTLSVWLDKVAQEIGISATDMTFDNSRNAIPRIWLQLMKGKLKIAQEGLPGPNLFRKGETHQDFYFDRENPVRLTHTTWSTALEGILKTGALQSARLTTENFGIPQTGEMREVFDKPWHEKDMRIAWDENTVSFFVVPEERAISIGTLWRSGRPLDYVVIFGIGEK